MTKWNRSLAMAGIALVVVAVVGASPGTSPGVTAAAASASVAGAVAPGAGESQATTGPLIEGYGPVYAVPDPDEATPAELRAVFDVAGAPEANDEVNPSIETVARYLNMHAAAGVEADDMHTALVLHGAAGKYTLRQDAYRARFGVDNPNLELIERLATAGVRVILCGQTAAHRGFERDELAEPVTVAVSAMTALIALQQEGYALIAF